jgi:hypothetical protein
LRFVSVFIFLRKPPFQYRKCRFLAFVCSTQPKLWFRLA